jgi:hypothetical protein
MSFSKSVVLALPLIFTALPVLASGESLGGAMTANGCFTNGRVAKSYVICVEKAASATSGVFEFKVGAKAGYRDPVSGGSGYLDQVAVSLDIELQDPSNVLNAFGEVPVVVEATICRDTWGCAYSSQSDTLQLKRPYGYRMLKGTLSYLLYQDFKANSTSRIEEVKVSLPGRAEKVVIRF